jgi:hypothetical protein
MPQTVTPYIVETDGFELTSHTLDRVILESLSYWSRMFLCSVLLRKEVAVHAA